MSEELARPGEPLFRQVLRGYDRNEVDAYVDQLRQQIHQLQEQRTPDGAVKAALERVGGQVAATLQQASETAAEIVSGAQREAEQHKREATEHTTEVVAVAERRVRELDVDADRIWAERERIVADAQDLARQLQGIADLAAERFPADSSPAGATGIAARVDHDRAGD